jgi:hypothetical protein
VEPEEQWMSHGTIGWQNTIKLELFAMFLLMQKLNVIF